MGKRGEKSPLANPMVLRSRMDDSCNICTMHFTPRDACVSCSRCNFHFHCGCVGMTDRFYKHFIVQKQTPWYCHVCNVEIRNQTRKNTEAINDLREIVETVSDEMKRTNIEIEKIKATQETCVQAFEHEIMEKVSSQLADFTTELSKKLPPTTNALPSSTGNPGRRKNVIIRGVPESSNENVPAIVKKIARVLNFNHSNFIDNCFRLPSREQSDNASSIILKFNTELERDEFLKCYFSFLKKHSLSPSDIGLVGTRRIFVNEHMDPKLHLVLKSALLMRKNNQLTNVSTHWNHVSVKNGDGWHRIYSMDDLKKLERVQHIDDDSNI